MVLPSALLLWICASRFFVGVLFVKAALAVVPAAIILATIAFVLSPLFVGGAPGLLERFKL